MTVDVDRLAMWSELANIGSGSAATALSSFLDARIDLEPPTARALPLAEAFDCLMERSGDVSVVLFELAGELDGVMLLLMEEPSDYLAALGAPEEMWPDVLAEVGNIFAAHFTDAIERMTGRPGRHTPPAVAMGDRITLMPTVLALAAGVDPVWVLQTRLCLHAAESRTEFVYLPGSSALESMEVLM